MKRKYLILLMIVICINLISAYSIEYQSQEYEMCNIVKGNFTIFNSDLENSEFEIINNNDKIKIAKNHNIKNNKTINFEYEPICEFTGEVRINVLIKNNENTKQLTFPIKLISKSKESISFNNQKSETNNLKLNLCNTTNLKFDFNNDNNYDTAYLIEIKDTDFENLNRSQVIKINAENSEEFNFELNNQTKRTQFKLEHTNVLTNQLEEIYFNVNINSNQNCTSELINLSPREFNYYGYGLLILIFILLLISLFGNHKSKINLRKNKKEPVLILNKPEKHKFLKYQNKIEQINNINEKLKELKQTLSKQVKEIEKIKSNEDKKPDIKIKPSEILDKYKEKKIIEKPKKTIKKIVKKVNKKIVKKTIKTKPVIKKSAKIVKKTNKKVVKKAIKKKSNKKK
ncbi:hypothetical protein HOK68_04805 [Candidatus Woesearchaeota archaeon]|jgi:hypothetical protein|nr:hypothetical protein [Candidatus Woesearchaeota archaeon]MBT4596242.1 hypothetical protein [Candidatus Woesearchaeota archaeon]MBT5741535.1 hypothetical protein [Candidatus Woesearchaeota archaeon]MBT6506067.1 hypothetical protein [Candidatus Woesearchaeota archaeon]MBT7849196.1 hypothetical protein [Candidatus Woesearchaeota archaeon]